MRRLLIALIVVLVAALTATPALTQEFLDPFNCAAQDMIVGGGYECAPQGAAVTPPPATSPAHVFQGGYHWYWYPESGWWYESGGSLYPEGA
jgi:hypothetical protein